MFWPKEEHTVCMKSTVGLRRIYIPSMYEYTGKVNDARQRISLTRWATHTHTSLGDGKY